jgi:hypothetical protein
MCVVSKRSRVLAFGSAGLLVVAGVVCAAVVGGGTGGALAMVLIGLGLVAATSLVFLEVGLSEDRERARERRQRARSAPGARGRPQGLLGRRDRPRFERSLGHRRRLK